jgi:hypothetical protein
MALTYKPIGGNAGTILFELIHRPSNVTQNTVSINVINFEEDDEESSFTEVFENINDVTIKDYYGFKKKISFGLVNRIQDSDTEDYLGKILSLASFINLVNNYPRTYRLSITYRDGSGATISDAIQIGNIKLAEVSASSNSGQIIDLEFSDRNSHDIDFSVVEYNDGLALEDDSGYILLENGGLILLETYLIPET